MDKEKLRKFFIGRTIVLIILVVVVALGFFAWKGIQLLSINDFESCKKAGFPVMETYPEQCRAMGQTFVRMIK